MSRARRTWRDPRLAGGLTITLKFLAKVNYKGAREEPRDEVGDASGVLRLAKTEVIAKPSFQMVTRSCGTLIEQEPELAPGRSGIQDIR